MKTVLEFHEFLTENFLCFFVEDHCGWDTHLTLFLAACSGCLWALKMEMVVHGLVFEVFLLSLSSGQQQMCYRLGVFLFDWELPHPQVLQKEGKIKIFFKCMVLTSSFLV